MSGDLMPAEWTDAEEARYQANCARSGIPADGPLPDPFGSAIAAVFADAIRARFAETGDARPSDLSPLRAPAPRL